MTKTFKTIAIASFMGSAGSDVKSVLKNLKRERTMTKFTTFAAATAAIFTLTASAQGAAHSAAATVCDDGWSATDVDGNGYISTIEMNAYAEKQTQQMDADKSGTVSKDEYVNCSMAAQKQEAQPAKRSEADMQALDADGDGMISRGEYRDATASNQEAAASGDAEAVELSGRLIYLIKDTPAPDYTIMSLDEFAARAALMFAAIDADQNDALTREEFMQEVPPMTDISEVLNRDFDTADTDASGDLTTTELVAANTKNADYAIEQASSDGNAADDPEAGAPVVYFRFDNPT